MPVVPSAGELLRSLRSRSDCWAAVASKHQRRCPVAASSAYSRPLPDPDVDDIARRIARRRKTDHGRGADHIPRVVPVSYTHLRAHETVLDLVCRLLLEKK